MWDWPFQDAIADDDDEAIGHEPAHSDHDHSGHDQVGARERAAVHDHRPESGRDPGHFADHDQDPGKSMGDAEPTEDRRQRGREHHLAKHARARAAEHGGGLEQANIDRAHPEDGVEQDRVERAEKHQEYRRIRPEPEEYHRERQPGGDGNRPQQVDGRIQQLPQDPDTSDHQPERNADQRREKETAVDPRHRLPHVGEDGAAERIVIDAAEGEVVHHHADVAGARHQSRAANGDRAIPQGDEQQGKADPEGGRA
jgi:hypothetical protein